jgi:hypothetical protein
MSETRISARKSVILNELILVIFLRIYIHSDSGIVDLAFKQALKASF